jgi:hypothetical protein
MVQVKTSSHYTAKKLEHAVQQEMALIWHARGYLFVTVLAVGHKY